MDRIASFSIDHTKLLTGLYVSHRDKVGSETATTFDIRMTRPNTEPAMSTAGIHTIEHLGATFLRNHPVWSSRVIYFGPMGCRTGFYLVMAGDLTSADILQPVTEMFDFIRSFEGAVPGASAVECGNYLDMNLSHAKFYARKYFDEFLNAPGDDRMIYPE